MEQRSEHDLSASRSAAFQYRWATSWFFYER